MVESEILTLTICGEASTFSQCYFFFVHSYVFWLFASVAVQPVYEKKLGRKRVKPVKYKHISCYG